MASVKERFLRYVAVDTQSQEGVEQIPSTEKQFQLARMLEKELRELGASEVRLDENCYVTATIPANRPEPGPVVGLLAHMDTSDAVSGANVRPVLTPGYRGGEIPMGEGYVLSPAEYPALLHHIDQEIICSDGSTLLGADDKAGVAEIMTLCQRLLQKDAPPHGTLRIGFTPDEEVGRGVDGFDVGAFHADFAYTVDGGELGEINCENFNAAFGEAVIHGVSIHPGSARGKMVNASLVAMELQSMLPACEPPACTEGYEGFFHLERITGRVDRAEVQYLIRDHNREKFEQKKALFLSACAYLNEKYGPGALEPSVRDSYFNMKEKVDPSLVEAAKAAMRAVGVEPFVEPIRGGTDGARLSFMGLPCPNLCTGGYNYHGRYEFIAVESMEKVVDILEKLVTSF